MQGTSGYIKLCKKFHSNIWLNLDEEQIVYYYR